MQTFGRRLVVAFRKSKSAPWMAARCRTGPVMCMVGGRKVSSRAVVAPERGREARLLDLDAVEPLEEVDMEIGAPELAIGRILQADALLGAHDLADALVLDRAQARVAELAFLVLRSRDQQALSAAGSCRHGRRETAVSGPSRPAS